MKSKQVIKIKKGLMKNTENNDTFTQIHYSHVYGKYKSTEFPSISCEEEKNTIHIIDFIKFIRQIISFKTKGCFNVFNKSSRV